MKYLPGIFYDTQPLCSSSGDSGEMLLNSKVILALKVTTNMTRCRDTRIPQTYYNIINIFLLYCYEMVNFCGIYVATFNKTFITMFIPYYSNKPLHVTTPRVSNISISSTNVNIYMYHTIPQLVILLKS